jgi:C4-type Zn-finger protein
MNCPNCGSAKVQAVSLFESKWFAANVIEQSLAFVCLRCGYQWRAPKPDTRLIRNAKDAKEVVGCVAVLFLVCLVFGVCTAIQ